MTRQSKSGKAKNQPNLSSNPSGSYKIFPTEEFLKDAKKLLKKYPNIKDDFLNLARALKKNPHPEEDLGGGFHKVRMDIADKVKGKSGCARVLVQVFDKERKIAVLRAIDKGDISTFITDAIKKMFSKSK